MPEVALKVANERLTALAHGGGCGCKIAPGVLRELLHGQFAAPDDARLLVGNGTSDDAAVWALDEERCLIATTDFFMPVVDDPHHFGQIAATNAISDVYAMGGKPIFALAIVGMPLGKLDTATIREILAGGAEACRRAGIAVVGGHSIDSAEPIYGLAVLGECPRENLRTNAGAQTGDALILTKPLGVGIYSAAFKREVLSEAGYAEMLRWTTTLNAIGAELGRDPAVHALTDVTGFGLLGHGLEMARAANLSISLDFAAVPLLAEAEALVRQGVVTGASGRNWASFGDAVSLGAGLGEWQRAVLADPQTSGGLLVSVAPDAAEHVLARIRAAGFNEAAVVGRVEAGPAGIRVS